MRKSKRLANATGIAAMVFLFIQNARADTVIGGHPSANLPAPNLLPGAPPTPGPASMGTVCSGGSCQTVDALFQTLNQSMWGPGSATTFTYSQTLLSGSWNVSGSAGGIDKVCFFGCAKFGAELSGSTSGSVGLGLNANFTSGSVNVKDPVQFTLKYPDPETVAPGAPFSISSSYSVLPGAELTTASPDGHIGLNADFALKASVGAQACFFGCASGSATLINTQGSKELVSIDGKDLKTSVSGPLGLSASASFPVIDTKGTGGPGDSLRSEGQSNFLTVKDDLSSAVAQALGLPPLSGDISFGIGKIHYNIASLGVAESLNAVQDLSFLPVYWIDLKANDGQDYVFPAGASITIPFDPSLSEMEFTPTYFLTDQFTNDIGLNSSSCFDVSALAASAQLNAFGHSFGIGGFGPLVNKNFCGTTSTQNVFDKNWELGGFNTVTGAEFTVVPTPEGNTFLMGFGVVLILASKVLRQRKNSLIGGVLFAIAVLCVTGILAGCSHRAKAGSVRASQPQEEYSAVLLDNGQLFIGKLDLRNNGYPVLTDVYYVQAATDPVTHKSQNLLVKRGTSEWHAPQRMAINAAHIILIEPVGADSKVSHLIAEMKTQNELAHH